MSKAKNISGQRFGRLVATSQAGSNKAGTALWNCDCDCGKTLQTLGTSLRNGNTRSCGCLIKDQNKEPKHILPTGNASFNALLVSYTKSADRRGIEWMLTKKEFRTLTAQDCYYCGTPASAQFKSSKNCNGSYRYNRIDRYDNLLGYTLANSVSCCSKCNYAKRTMVAEKYIAHCARVAKHQERHT